MSQELDRNVLKDVLSNRRLILQMESVQWLQKRILRNYQHAVILVLQQQEQRLTVDIEQLILLGLIYHSKMIFRKARIKLYQQQPRPDVTNIIITGTMIIIKPNHR
jgi:hypothetical protein